MGGGRRMLAVHAKVQHTKVRTADTLASGVNDALGGFVKYYSIQQLVVPHVYGRSGRLYADLGVSLEITFHEVPC